MTKIVCISDLHEHLVVHGRVEHVVEQVQGVLDAGACLPEIELVEPDPVVVGSVLH